jgi:hypothetical protein
MSEFAKPGESWDDAKVRKKSLKEVKNRLK